MRRPHRCCTGRPPSAPSPDPEGRQTLCQSSCSTASRDASSRFDRRSCSLLNDGHGSRLAFHRPDGPVIVYRFPLAMLRAGHIRPRYGGESEVLIGQSRTRTGASLLGSVRSLARQGRADLGPDSPASGPSRSSRRAQHASSPDVGPGGAEKRSMYSMFPFSPGGAERRIGANPLLETFDERHVPGSLEPEELLNTSDLS